MNGSVMCSSLQDINFVILQSSKFKKAHLCTVVSSLMTKWLNEQEKPFQSSSSNLPADIISVQTYFSLLVLVKMLLETK